MLRRWSVFQRGKFHKKYEFGCKVSYVTSSKGNFVLGAQSLKKGSYDGHTLRGALSQVSRLLPSGLSVERVYIEDDYFIKFFSRPIRKA